MKNLFLEKELNPPVAFKEFKVFILNETRSVLPRNCRRVRVQPAKQLRDNRSSFAKMLFNYQNQLSHSELFEVRRTPSAGFGVLAKTNLTVEQGIVFCKEELIGFIKVFEDKIFEKLANDVHYPSLFSDRNMKGVSIGFLSLLNHSCISPLSFYQNDLKLTTCGQCGCEFANSQPPPQDRV